MSYLLKDSVSWSVYSRRWPDTYQHLTFIQNAFFLDWRKPCGVFIVRFLPQSSVKFCLMENKQKYHGSWDEYHRAISYSWKGFLSTWKLTNWDPRKDPQRWSLQCKIFSNGDQEVEKHLNVFFNKVEIHSGGRMWYLRKQWLLQNILCEWAWAGNRPVTEWNIPPTNCMAICHQTGQSLYPSSVPDMYNLNLVHKNSFVSTSFGLKVNIPLCKAGRSKNIAVDFFFFFKF